MRFCFLVVAPPGWQHAGMYAELVETLVRAARRAGHHGTASVNTPDPSSINVLINPHMLPAEAAGRLPRDTVLYNLEHIEPDTWDWAPSLKSFLERFETWDYNRENLARLKGICPRAFWLPLGSEPEMTRIPKASPQDIDVLFYGYVNDRRRAVLEAIAARGLVVAAPFGVYGRTRDALISRAKVVINIHQVEGRVIEMVRVSYLLANRKAVVTEGSAGMDAFPGLEGALHCTPLDGLAGACELLVKDNARRRALELAGHRWISARRQSEYFKELLKARSRKA